MEIVLAAAWYLVCIAACIFIADFITGLMHWAEDTWLAPGKSALLDRWIVNDNIEHHRSPGKIRAGHYWETNRVCMALAVVVASALAMTGVHAWQPYLVLALLSQSNQIHMWAHTAQPPTPIAWLQRAGILQSTRHHAKHHKNPYASRFCTITNYLNPALDHIGFWRMLENVGIAVGATVYRATAARAGY